MSDRLNRRPNRSLLGVERLEDRTTPAFGPTGGGLSIAVGTVFEDTTAPYAVNNNYIVGNGSRPAADRASVQVGRHALC